MTTKDEALALALTPELVRQWGKLKTEPLGNGDSHEVVVITLTRLRHLFDAAITAIKQAQEPKVKLIPTAEEMGTPMQPQAITPETGNAAPPEASAITAGNGQAPKWYEPGFDATLRFEDEPKAQQAQEPVQSENERIKAFLHKHKASALPDGACECCEGEGEIGGQFAGGTQECPDCNGSGKAAPKQAEPTGKQSLQVPEGYKLVPVEPTREMLVALVCTGLRNTFYEEGRSRFMEEMAQGYAAMLKAAPEAKQ